MLWSFLACSDAFFRTSSSVLPRAWKPQLTPTSLQLRTFITPSFHVGTTLSRQGHLFKDPLDRILIFMEGSPPFTPVRSHSFALQFLFKDLQSVPHDLSFLLIQIEYHNLPSHGRRRRILYCRQRTDSTLWGRKD